MPRLLVLSIPLVLAGLLILSGPSVVAAGTPFLEKFALAENRPAVLKELIPGTDDYYYYHALHHQVQKHSKELTAILKAWTEKLPGDNARREIILTRQILLDYSTDPAKSLAQIKEKLALAFDHQQQSDEARAELPSALDPKAIAPDIFLEQALNASDSLEKITDTGLYALASVKRNWKLSETRQLLKRLTRPDYPGLVQIIAAELKDKDAGFGAFPVHTMLTAEQLAALQKLVPDLINNAKFTTAVLYRMRPLDTEDAQRDPAVREAWLERLWAYASTLNPNANPLKANLLYHLLALDEKRGRLNPQRLLAYLKLPRPVPYVNPRYKEDRDIWRFPAKLDYDPSAFTGTAPVGNDEPLLRRLVIRYLTSAKNADAIAPLVADTWLRAVLAEAKLLSGAPEPQRWVSLLPPDAFKTLRERTDIDFDPASKQNYAPDDIVALDVWIKNVPSLLVRVYEVNTANVHRTTGEQVSTGLNLDGLTANREQKFDYQDAPIFRTKQTFSFPEMNGKRGVWIIEFVGGGKASRALIQKGGLRTIVRQTVAGTALTVLDEKNRPVPGAFAMVGPKKFSADEQGLIALPLSTQPGPAKVIIDDGTGFTALETIELQGENYTLEAGFHVPRESLLPGSKATLLLRPVLKSNGRPGLLDMLDDAKLTLSSVTLDGTPATAVFPLGKLAEDKETTVEFSVPERLKSLTMSLAGEVKSVLTGQPVKVSTNHSLDVNGLTASGMVSDLHLSRNGGTWLLQEFGLTGEPRAGREVNVSFVRPEYVTQVPVSMKTDATGTIALGSLDGIASITATHADGLTRSFALPQDRSALPDVIHAKAGETVMIPWQGDALLGPAEVSMLERRNGSFVRLVPLPAKITGGYLVWKNLPAGTYSLYVKGQEIRVRVSPGEIADGHLLTSSATLQLTSNRPLTVSAMQEADIALSDNKGSEKALVFHVSNISAETRVHVFASRFLPEFDAMQTLGRVNVGAPSATHLAWLSSVYLSARNIGDEYRYVLERRSAARFAGNMLARPGLLLNPWEIAETEMDKQKLVEAEKLERAERGFEPAKPMNQPAAAPDPMAAAEASAAGSAPPPTADISFLATPGPVALNLKPDANGNVAISRAALGDRQYIRVLAVDRESSAVRDFSLAAAVLPPRDLRLSLGLEPTQHFSQQNRITLLEKDAPFRFNDALAAQFQSLGHLGAVHQLFSNLTQNPLLAEFSWLLEWPKLDEKRRRELYSKYACHELHFFLARKDPAFFKSVVQPFLANKRDRTFMDGYLLGADLMRYLQPWHYGQLNTLERLLLAERLPAEQSAARRLTEDWMSIQPVNRPRDMFLFETALRGRALMVNRIPSDGQIPLIGKLFDSDVDGTTIDVSLAPQNVEFEGFIPMPGSTPLQTSGVAEAKAHWGMQGVPNAYYYGYNELNGKGSNRALGYADLGQFEEAKKELESELARDPGNVEVRRQLEGVQRQRDSYFKSARDETRLKMLNGVDNLWVDAVPGTAKVPVITQSGSEEGGTAPISFKLNYIIIDHLRFTEADINEVVSYLRRKSVEADVVESDPNKRGVDFIVRGVEGAKRVTLDLQNVRLLDALKSASEVAGVRFDVQPNAVVMVPAGVGGASLTTRVFAVPRDFLAGRTPQGAPEVDDPFAEPSDKTKPAPRSQPSAKSVLESLGITFPEGSLASFDPETGRLAVRNSEDQLDLVETLTEAMRSSGPESTLYKLYGTPRLALTPTDARNKIPNRGSNDPLETGDFDNGVGLVPDGAYYGRVADKELLARQQGRAKDGTDRFFRQLEQTRVWAEQNYYRLPIEAQTAALVPLNRFWRDYALWDGKSPFVSTNVADAAGSFSEMILALAVLDLPFPSEFKAGKMETKENVLTLTPASPAILFHQEVRPAEPDNGGAKLLVSQHFYREGDRYIEEGGEKTDKFVSAEFLTGVVYGCQVVVTNPSSSRQRLDVLFQIPVGSLPVKATRRVRSLPVQLEPFRTQTLDFHFYFPQPGKFAHFPVHISRNAKTAAFAAPFVFNVVGKPQINDPASWDYVSQHGSANAVLSFLDQHNLYFLDLDKMLWRMKDADFFRRAIAQLKGRHVFHPATWSYAVLHNAGPYLTEFLMQSDLTGQCGPAFESPMLTIDPVEQQTYQHLEYSPLVNARAHPLGGTQSILNDKFRVQWESLLHVLAFRARLTAGDLLAVAGYMALQDRIEEALEFFGKVDRAGVAGKLQYEYLRAWLAMCQDDTATARRIATALAPRGGGLQPPSAPNEPQKKDASNAAKDAALKDGRDAAEAEVANLRLDVPLHWGQKFAALKAQLDEIDGKPGASADMEDRESSQDALAEKEPAISLTVENKTVAMKYRNLSEVTVNYYPMDLEFLFSSSPFVTQDTSRFRSIRPNRSDRIMLPGGGDSHIFALPGEFQSANVLVEVTGGGQTKAVAVYANSLDVQLSESFGQLTVHHRDDKRSLSKVYVKVFADQNGVPVFYRDGYTDLRGKFDYASLSTGDLDGARRFSLLIISEDFGATVKEVKPPTR